MKARNGLVMMLTAMTLIATPITVGCGGQAQTQQDWGWGGNDKGGDGGPEDTAGTPDTIAGDNPAVSDSVTDNGVDTDALDVSHDLSNPPDSNDDLTAPDAGEDVAAPDAGNWTGPDLSGMWAQLQVSSTMTKPVIGQPSQSVTRSISLLRIAQNGPNLVVSYHVCDFVIDSGSGVVQTVIPDAFIEALEDADKPARIDSSEGGWAYHQPPFIELFGLKAGFDAQSLPEDPDDPAVFDQDNDGNPGMTIQMSGLVAGNLYMIQRRTSSLNGPLEKVQDGIFDGLIDFTNEQVYLGSDNVTLLQMLPERYPDTDSSHSYYRTSRFQLQATTDEAFCKYIVDNQDSLFARGE